MALAVLAVLYFIGIKDQPRAFIGFFASFMALFCLTGIGNASTFQMIPAIMRKDIPRLMPGADEATRNRQSELEGAAIIGFSSAIGAYGGFFIPKAYGTSIAMTGAVDGALWAFFAFYLTCIAITWAVYTRKGGVLHDVERRRAAPVLQPAE